MLRFCLLCLSSRKEIVQISALKVLKFIFETQGCSLDYSMVFILKSILTTFPKPQKINGEDRMVEEGDFNMELLFGERMDDPGIILFRDGPLRADASHSSTKPIPATKILSSQEPSSGFAIAITNIYTHVLDTFISVLSSVSSHILHSIFYDVIGDFLLIKNEDQSARGITQEVRVYACKIAEKIITIC